MICVSILVLPIAIAPALNGGVPRLALQAVPSARPPASTAAAQIRQSDGTNAVGSAATQTDTLPPFLTLFRQRDERRIVAEDVAWPTAWGMQAGLWVHRELRAGQRLPALLLLPGEPSKTERVRRCADELAQIGYGVLVATVSVSANAVNPEAREQQTLSQWGSAVYWLRRRDDVTASRIGVVGWSNGADWALKLAAAAGLEAGVAVDPSSFDQASALALESTAVLVVGSGGHTGGLNHGESPNRRWLSFPDAKPGFLFPDAPAYHFDHAEEAWFQIYEFVDEHLQHADAAHDGDHHEPGAATEPAASLAELMRSLNGPLVVRGRIAESLAGSPDAAHWSQLRADTALLVDGSHLMQARQPRRGTSSDWQSHWQRYQAAAEELQRAAKSEDLSAAQAGLRKLGDRCAACHRDHR